VIAAPPLSSGLFPAVVPFPFLGDGVTTSLSLGGALSAGDLNAGDRTLAALAGFDALRDPGTALCFVEPFSS
jgi:hypothetical protein